MRIGHLLAAALALSLPSCALVTTGPEQAIRVSTEPEGATCELTRDGSQIAMVSRTPAAAIVSKSGHDIAVNCAMAGRANGAAVIPAHAQAATFGNLIIGGILGYGLDLASGAAAEYPRGVRIWLDPLGLRSERTDLYFRPLVY